MANTSQQTSSSFSLPEVPVSLRAMPDSLREVPGLPFKAGRHITAWVVWQTSRVSMLDDHSQPQPPDTDA